MNPPFQQVTLGNQQRPPVAAGPFVNPTMPDGKLWGSNARRSMGTTQTICGGIGFVLGIAVTCLPSYYFDHIDYVGWAIWTGVFAIVTGFLGVLSFKSRCMVIAYMITSIITAVLCAGCFLYAVFGISAASYDNNRAANQALYTIMCIVFFVHMVISIIGASFTCGVVCCTTNQAQQVVYYTPLPLHQQYGPTPPYTVTASQGDVTSKTTTTSANGAFVSQMV